MTTFIELTDMKTKLKFQLNTYYITTVRAAPIAGVYPKENLDASGQVETANGIKYSVVETVGEVLDLITAAET